MKSSRAPIITLVSLLVAAFISFSPSAAATGLNKGQQAKVKSLLTALASADPNKIKSAKIKFTAPDSKAFGQPNNKVIALETKGSVKVSASTASLNSSYNSFDFTANTFTFDKSGKITNWSIKSTVDGKNKKLSNLLFEVDANASSGGLTGSTGYVYVQPDNGTTFQLLVKNTASNLKSWSYAGGQYGAPNNKWFTADTNPSGCLYPGQSAFFIAELVETPQIVAGTGAAFEAPIFNGCGDGSSALGGSFRFITN